MKKLYAFLALFSIILFSAQNLQKIAQEITDEGILLYRSEMTSWYGTDVFLASYTNRENIGGYFSYIDNEVPKCVFFSKENKVIGTVAFPANYESENAKLDLKERPLSETENDYFVLRQKTNERIKSDSIFKFYEKSNFNIIPIINKKQKKVYVITGTNENNVVLFGNDYLLTFNKNNEITKVERLHQSLIAQKITDEEVGKTVSGIHSHVLEDWQFMTPTDICTLMLYQKFTDWESYNVVSTKYTSLWNPKSNNLIILLTDVVKKINEDQKIRHPEKNE